MKRIDALARITEDPGGLTRTYGSPAMRRANDLVAGWMRAAGMTTREDAIGNLIGHYPGAMPDAKVLLLGSHLDTVRDAGKFDGALGVLVALACVEHLQQQNKRLAFALDVIGFADEEGVRFHTTYLGSRAVAGTFNLEDLKRLDAAGISMAEAIRAFAEDPSKLAGVRRDPGTLLGYVEVHIEQGPVLDKAEKSVGVVPAVSGQTRLQVHFTGQARHAGTTPMSLRQDALVAAAEFILTVESITSDDPELLATVGQIRALPGASNVIPGDVMLSVDLRHRLDEKRRHASEDLQTKARGMTTKRGIIIDWEVVQETPSISCAGPLSDLLMKAARNHQESVPLLASGAGHDAAAVSAIAPVAMLFVRCKDGVSHHPDESVQADDVRVAIAVMNDFLDLLARQHPGLA
jgi:allantoate deiminase